MGKYDDIINLPHHVSGKRARMSMVDRGAQFSPFAALTGYDAVIEESARLTDQERSLDESRRTELDLRLQLIAEAAAGQPEVTATWFVPDEKKAGGAYVRRTGKVLKVDGFRGQLILTDGTRIPFDALTALDGALFEALE